MFPQPPIYSNNEVLTYSHHVPSMPIQWDSPSILAMFPEHSFVYSFTDEDGRTEMEISRVMNYDYRYLGYLPIMCPGPERVPDTLQQLWRWYVRPPDIGRCYEDFLQDSHCPDTIVSGYNRFYDNMIRNNRHLDRDDVITDNQTYQSPLLHIFIPYDPVYNLLLIQDVLQNIHVTRANIVYVYDRYLRRISGVLEWFDPRIDWEPQWTSNHQYVSPAAVYPDRRIRRRKALLKLFKRRFRELESYTISDIRSKYEYILCTIASLPVLYDITYTVRSFIGTVSHPDSSLQISSRNHLPPDRSWVSLLDTIMSRLLSHGYDKGLESQVSKIIIGSVSGGWK
jgi:hypothetical protein